MNAMAFHLVHRFPDGIDFRLSHFDFRFHERVIVRADAYVIVAVFLLGDGHLGANDRIDSTD